MLAAIGIRTSPGRQTRFAIIARRAIVGFDIEARLMLIDYGTHSASIVAPRRNHPQSFRSLTIDGLSTRV
jgi:hypothetical protein